MCNEYLTDLLVEFDEMSFIPGTTHPNPYEYACDWKHRLLIEIRMEKREILDKYINNLLEHYPNSPSIKKTIEKERAVIFRELYDDGEKRF